MNGTISLTYAAKDLDDLRAAVDLIGGLSGSTPTGPLAAGQAGRPADFVEKLERLMRHKPYNAQRLLSVTRRLEELGYLPYGPKGAANYVSFHDAGEPGSPNLGNMNSHTFRFMREGDSEVVSKLDAVKRAGRNYVINITGDESVEAILNAAARLKRPT
jgi:hypothetical protein